MSPKVYRSVDMHIAMSPWQDPRHDLREQARFGDMLRKSPGMRAVRQQILDLADLDSPVLLEGEPGTGKEYVARQIHLSSSRRNHPFIVVQAAGMSEAALVERLVGQVGEPVDNAPRRVGLLAEVGKGTLFFAEIGEVPLNLQVGLARMLRNGETVFPGSAIPWSLDARIIGATARNLFEEASRGSFNHELLYRLRVARIYLPPLRERCGDLPFLVEFFLENLREKSGPVPRIDEEALGLLLAYPWPGNMSELQSVLEYAALRCKGEVIGVKDLPPELLEGTGGQVGLARTDQQESERFRAALVAAKGNRSLAARLLGISRATFYRRIRVLGINDRS